MNGLFIRKDESIALTTDPKGGGITLLARAGGMEAMRQRINKNATVWITPAEDKETVEFFYVLTGTLEIRLEGETVFLNAGDSFYADGLERDVQMGALTQVELMYIANRPLFDSVFGFQDDLMSLLRQINAKDDYTLLHSWDVMEYSVKLMEYMDLSDRIAMDNMVVASLFHDVGKCFVPDSILKSHAPLSQDEMRHIMRHPVDGGRLLKPHYSPRVVEIVKHHHERLDGTGYPYGLEGDDISMEARIVATADVFDAMTTDRGYNKVRTYVEAADELTALPDQFDGEVARALEEMARDGTVKTLSEKVRNGHTEERSPAGPAGNRS